ncbi:hypothetical protein FBU30_007668 [Linnemannia zychae]|nr:hypothetical protein FBU30_007668 [Linnemannia zychae]
MDPNDFILLDGARSLNFMHRDLCLMKITALKKTVALSKTSESMATSEVSKNTSCGIIATKTQQQTRRDLKVHYNSVLKNWINHNSLHPFPTKKEKLELCEKASISEKQLNNWFTNYRRRHLRTK